MAGCSVLMYKIDTYINYSIDELVRNLENNVLDETGVIIDECSKDTLAGTYVYSEISKSREYNFEQNKFEVVTQKKYVATEFHLNLRDKYLDVWGKQKNAQHIITAISLAFGNNVSIEPAYFDFIKMVNYLKDRDSIYVNKVTICGLVLEKELLADCTIDLNGKEQPFKIIDRYKDNINRVSFRWKSDNNVVAIVLYRSGAITIHKQRHLITCNELNNIYGMLLYARR